MQSDWLNLVIRLCTANHSDLFQRNMAMVWEVVVAQLVEQSLPILEMRGSNPVIGKNLLTLNICILSTVY